VTQVFIKILTANGRDILEDVGKKITYLLS